MELKDKILANLKKLRISEYSISGRAYMKGFLDGLEEAKDVLEQEKK